MLRKRIGYLCAFAIFLCASTLQAEQEMPPSSIAEILSLASHHYEDGKYKQSLKLLVAIADKSLEDAEQYKTLYRLLALCYFEAKDKEKVKEYLENWLYLAPDAELDPFSTPPDLLDVFRIIKMQFQEKQKEIELAKEAIIKSNPSENKGPFLPSSKATARLLSFIPFGIPQLASGQHVKGSLLLSGEIAMLGLNIGAYWWKQSLAIGPRQVMSEQDLHQYKVAQGIQFAAIGVFLAIYLYSVIDGLIYPETLLQNSP